MRVDLSREEMILLSMHLEKGLENLIRENLPHLQAAHDDIATTINLRDRFRIKLLKEERDGAE